MNPLNRFAEMHWGEGMLLKPQHFQLLQRQMNALITGTVGGLQPYTWGIRRLDLDEAALENFVLSINFLDARLPDGTVIRVPDNADLSDLEIKKALEEADGKPLEIRIGVPVPRPRGANLAGVNETGDGVPRRYRVDEIELDPPGRLADFMRSHPEHLAAFEALAKGFGYVPPEEAEK